MKFGRHNMCAGSSARMLITFLGGPRAWARSDCTDGKRDTCRVGKQVRILEGWIYVHLTYEFFFPCQGSLKLSDQGLLMDVLKDKSSNKAGGRKFRDECRTRGVHVHAFSVTPNCTMTGRAYRDAYTTPSILPTRHSRRIRKMTKGPRQKASLTAQVRGLAPLFINNADRDDETPKRPMQGQLLLPVQDPESRRRPR